MALNINLTLSDEQLSIIARHIVNVGIIDQLLEKKEVPLEEQLLTIKQVSELTNVTTQTINNHIKSGIINATKVGSQWRISRQALKDYANGK